MGTDDVSHTRLTDRVPGSTYSLEATCDRWW